MKIGALAQATETSVEAIRHYEREGLLSPATRTASNYRVYHHADVQRLNFIRRCRSLDMALPEVGRLLAIVDGSGGSCADVNRVLEEHLQSVAARVRELQELEQHLEALRARCKSPDAIERCGILNDLRRAPGVVRRVAKSNRAIEGFRG